ncbi:olfactory receptor 1019-like [Spea bombifrons]|uniref:olfactory receptor 1019-like n=1 Tax=Spea bombifrons TaxID=233779 RepID=UPI002349C759|nr:olfactory receptor 1019-like [Spea bombifrons]
MKSGGKQNVTEFSIQGLTNVPELQLTIFFIFLFSYVIIIVGNKTIFVVILCDPHLHTPMYIFLMNLSLFDIANVSNILPNLLNILLTKHTTISFAGCITQMYLFLALTLSEIVLFAAMAYDRYVAICHPLHYFILMSLKHCALLIIASWSFGFIDAVGHAVQISKMSFCASHVINHIFCDVEALMKLSCSGTFFVEMLTFVEGALVPVPACLLTLTSYIFIISSILKIKSAEGRQKAFSTCSSHLICISVFYGTILFSYMRPTSSYSPKQDKFFSLLYIVLVPILNPLIYTLKNQEVKNALKKLKEKLVCA